MNTQKPSPLLPVWVWKVFRHQPQQAIPSPKRKASDREVWSSRWEGLKKLTMPFYIRRRTVWWSLHSKAIGKGNLTTEAKVGQREGKSFSLFAPSSQWNCEQKLEESGEIGMMELPAQLRRQHREKQAVWDAVSERATDWWPTASEDLGH